MAWQIQDLVPNVFVRSVAEAEAFYQCLEFKRAWAWPKSEPVFVGVKHGSYTLMLAQSDSPAPTRLYFVVDDVEGCFDAMVLNQPWEVASRGGDSVPEALVRPESPSVKDHGHLDFTLVDPWGNHLTFGCESVAR